MNPTGPTTSVNRRLISESPNVRGLSARDGRLVTKQWIGDRADARQNFGVGRDVQKIQRDLTRLKHRVLGMPPSGNEQYPAPFQFYNVTPGNGFAVNNGGTGANQFDTVQLTGGTIAPGGQPTILTIQQVSGNTGITLSLTVSQQGAYSVQPTYPNAVTNVSSGQTGLTVTAISSTDMWRTLQMRSGLIGVRPRFSALGYAPNSNQLPSELWDGCFDSTSNVFGDFQQILVIDSDGLMPFTDAEQVGNAIMLGANGTPVLLTGYTAMAADFVSYSQIILNAAPTSGDTLYQAGFWLEVVDSPTFCYLNLWGQMFELGTNPFPVSTTSINIIPVASVQVYGNETSVAPSIGQFLSGNVLNLFDSYFNNAAPVDFQSGPAAGSKMIFRGDWTVDNLSGQYFYPGDVCRDIISGSGFTNTIYMRTSYGQSVTAPNLDGVNWMPLIN